MSNNFEDYLPKIEVKHIDCTVEQFLDSKWLFNNIPWMNMDNRTAFLKLDKVSTIWYYNEEENKIDSLTVNEIGVSAFHGFAGNSYAFSFQLDGELVKDCGIEPKLMTLSEEETKEKLEKYLDNLIKRKEEEGKDLVEKYNKILLPKVKRKFC